MLKYKKTIYTFIGLLAAMFFVQSCEEDTLNKEQTSQRFVSSSEENFDNTVEIDDVITFSDVSPGVVSRQWSVDNGVAVLSPSDEGNITSSEKVVNAFFKQLGTHEIRLNQVFETDAFVGSRLAGKVLDTVITVRVISGINATVTANVVNTDGTLGTPLSMSDNAENVILAGTTVRYFIQSSGEPESYTWTFKGSSPEVVSEFVDEIDVKYTRLGVYDFSVDAGRNRPEGNFQVAYEDLLSVLPSTLPVTLDKASSTLDGKIKLEFSREIDVNSIDLADFSVTLENGGNPITSNISEITADPSAGNVLLITLDGEQMFSDDTGTFSYTQGGLLSTDAYLIDSFVDTDIEGFKGENLFASTSGYGPSFETSTDADWPVVWGSFGSLVISTAQAQDGSSSAYTEVASHVFNSPEDPSNPNQFVWIEKTTPVSLETGKKYELGVWIYLADRAMPSSFDPDIRFYWNLGGAIDFSAGPLAIFDSGFPVGEWVYRSIIVDFATTAEYTALLRGWNPDNTGNLKFYMDNLSINEVIVR